MTTHTGSASYRAHALVFLVSAVALNACGSEKPMAPFNPMPDGPPGGDAPTEQWVTASSRSWTMPAQTEGYECHIALAATDEYFTGFRLSRPSAAQTELFLVMRPFVPVTGDFACDLSATLGGEAIYAAGPGATAVTFSDGKGVHVPAGQYLLLVVHVNNSSAAPVTASTVVEGRAAAATAVTTPIDMFFAGKTAFSIPVGSDSVDAKGSCAMGTESHVVAELSLMRTLGLRERVTVTDTSLNQTIFNATFDPQHVAYASLPSDFDVPASSNLSVSCSFENHTGAVVSIGESAHNELCLSGIYRFPPKPPASVSPFECALGQTI